ncbi:site-specific DNA-methyltransferase [Clostridioides difficile]|nr:site-specific DNA-methyltransferase [Clostridioides difficile]
MLNIEKYRLINGDCIEEMDNIEDESIDLILCDLPFGVTSCEWDKVIDFKRLWKQYNRIIKPNRAIILFSIQPFTTQLIHSNISNYKYNWYWMKNTCTGFTFAKYQPMRKVEDICIFCKNKKSPLYLPQGLKEIEMPRIIRRKETKKEQVYKQNTLTKEYVQKYTNYPNQVLRFNKEVKCIHPTQKPVELLEYLIKTYSKENDVILDNCFGSGSAGVACAKTNRKFIGVELDENYYLQGKNRIERAYKDNL